MKKDVIDSFEKMKRQLQRYSARVNPQSQSRAQGKVLRVIYENDGIIAKDLAALLEVTPPGLSHKLEKLEEDGNIIRVRERKDLRIVKVFITRKGLETIAQRNREKGSGRSEFTDCLTESESALFCELCERMSARLEEIVLEEMKKTNLVLFELQKKKQTSSDDISMELLTKDMSDTSSRDK